MSMYQVPQQESNSNNCAVFVSLFIEHFLKVIIKYLLFHNKQDFICVFNGCKVPISNLPYFQDIEEYEECPGDFISKEHKWFKNEDATMQRQRWHRTLGILFDLNRTREL